MIRSVTNYEFSFIVDTFDEVDYKWPNGTRVFVIDDSTEYRLIEGVFYSMGSGGGSGQFILDGGPADATYFIGQTVDGGASDSTYDFTEYIDAGEA